MTAIPKAADNISPVVEGPDSILKLPGLVVEIPLERIYERTTVADARAPVG